MTPLQLALRYLEIFCSGKSVEALHELFTDDLVFRGPFHSSDSAKAYLDALRSDPPEAAEFELLHSYEDATSACLIYQYSKPGVSIPMAQMFKIRDGKICEILLIFDTRLFA